MGLTTIRSCVAVTALVTVLCVLGMSAFDAKMATIGGDVAMAHSRGGTPMREFFHVMTTIVLVGPTTLLATLMFRRSTLLNAELQRLVDRDRLTDAATRDFFFAKMESNPASYGVSLMVDIDNFKSINDTYGHLVGDEVIRHVARMLRKSVRQQDIVARFGGEEFVVFLDEQDIETGFEVAERMRQSIASAACDIDEVSLSVTVSIGGSLKEAFERIERSIGEADEAMYRAKQKGRNRIVFGSDLVPAA